MTERTLDIEKFRGRQTCSSDERGDSLIEIFNVTAESIENARKEETYIAIPGGATLYQRAFSTLFENMTENRPRWHLSEDKSAIVIRGKNTQLIIQITKMKRNLEETHQRQKRDNPDIFLVQEIPENGTAKPHKICNIRRMISEVIHFVEQAAPLKIDPLTNTPG